MVKFHGRNSLLRWLGMFTAALVLGGLGWTMMAGSGAMGQHGRLDFIVDSRGAMDRPPAVDSPQWQTAGVMVPVPTAPGQLWLRWSPPPVPDAGVDYAFSLDFAGISRLQVWEASPQGLVPTERAGASYPRRPTDLPGRIPVVRISAEATPTVVVLSAQSKLPLELRWRAEPVVDYQRWLQSDAYAMGLLVGLSLLSLWLVALLGDIRWDRVLASALALTSAAFCFQLVTLGLAQELLWPQHPGLTDLAQTVSVAALYLALLWLLVTVTDEHPRSRANSLALWAMMVASVIGLGVAHLFGAEAASRTGDGLFAVIMALAIWTLVASARRGNRHSAAVGWSLVPALVGGTIQVLRESGVVVHAHWIMAYATQIGAIVTVPLMWTVIARRARDLRDVAMQAAGGQQTDPLTGLVHERVARLRLDRLVSRCKRFNHQGGLLMISLHNLDDIQAERGRQVAETALLLAASRVRSIVESCDTAARWAGTRFVVLIEGPINEDKLIEIATRVIAHGLRRGNEMTIGSLLRFQVAGSLVTGTETDTALLLRRAGEALDYMHAHPERKAIRILKTTADLASQTGPFDPVATNY